MPELILFVDDEPDMEELVRQRFRRHVREDKFQLTFASNGRMALEKLEANEDLCLVVTDINMPEMDGLTLLSEARKLGRPLRMLVVSAYGDMKNIRSAMNQGAFDFVTKPIDFEDLEATLEKTLGEIENLRTAIRVQKELEQERIERLKAQEEGMKILEQNSQLLAQVNASLEVQVRERTRELSEKNQLLKSQMERSDELLLNILPYQTALELKELGKAETRYFEEVTVMFTDFRGFTRIAEQLNPSDLVNEIDVCFREFDRIMERYGIEKIKTIGDAYMAAAGLPVENKSHARDMVRAALDIQAYMRKHKAEREKWNKPVFEIRIGIHTGPVVAGIVGSKKFAYDIWGDTVNLASRMESSCETGCINISGSTYMHVNEDFTCRYRGEIAAKNKGLVNMFYVEGVNPEAMQNLNFEETRSFILSKLEAKLSPQLFYHSLAHTLDVYDVAEKLAELEGISPSDKTLLLTAALFHDTGFLIEPKGHESISCDYAREYLPGFGYQPSHIEDICGMIMATKLPQSPHNLLEQIICDADLDYLGRDDFWTTGDKLFLELQAYGVLNDVNQWNLQQIKFLESHRFFTRSAIALRKEKKDKHLEEVRARVESATGI